jgi:hypothetical protein
MVVTASRQVMVGGCNEETSGTFNQSCIRWCDIEDYADWTTTATNNAGEHILEGGDAIIAIRNIGSYVAVWTETGLHLGQYLGDPGQTFIFDRVATGCGLANPNAVVVHNAEAWWVDRALNLWRFSIGSSPTRVPCPISRDIADNAQPIPSRAAVGYLRRYNEVWVLYDDSRDTGAPTAENSRYFAFCVEESARQQRPIWFQGQFARSAFLDSPTVGADGSLSQYKSAALMGDTNGDIYLHDIDSIVPTSAHIQTADQYLDEGRRRIHIHGIIPDFERQSGDVSLSLLCRSYPQGDVTTKGPYTLADEADKKDFRASGMIVAAKVSASDASFRVGRPIFKAVTGGER